MPPHVRIDNRINVDHWQRLGIEHSFGTSVSRLHIEDEPKCRERTQHHADLRGVLTLFDGNQPLTRPTDPSLEMLLVEIQLAPSTANNAPMALAVRTRITIARCKRQMTSAECLLTLT